MQVCKLQGSFYPDSVQVAVPAMGTRDPPGVRSGVIDLFPKDENRETEVSHGFRFFFSLPQTKSPPKVWRIQKLVVSLQPILTF